MKNSTFALVFITAILAGVANAGQSIDLTDADWAAAARMSLSSAHRGQPVVVVDDALPPAALRGLQTVRAAVPLGELADSSDDAANPDGYLYIKQFEPHGDRVAFTSISNADRKSVGTNCGLETHVSLVRAANGAWLLDYPIRLSLCQHAEVKRQ